MNIEEIIKQEGDHRDFEYKGYKCHIHRNKSMHFLCGYVEVPHGNKYYGNDGEDLNVHGGITWVNNYLPYHKDKSDTWILGFDCGHAGDYIRMPHSELFQQPEEIYRTMEYVESEIKQLVDQIDN